MQRTNKGNIGRRSAELYLFFSVDIVGSTNIKYKKNTELPWFDVFQFFYKEFPKKFREMIKAWCSPYGIRRVPTVKIWKYAGDEILFYISISGENEAPLCVNAFYAAINEWYDGKNQKTTRLKGSIWLGQVPFIDRKIELETKVDFIGPSVDCGFRISKFATEHRLVMSMDVLLLCVKCDKFTLDIFYSGTELLKGIDWAKNYPIFYLFVSGDKQTDEKKYLLVPCKKEFIEHYVDVFYKSMRRIKYISKISADDISGYLDDKEEESSSILKANHAPEPMENASGVDEDTKDDKIFKDMKSAIEGFSKK